MNFASKYGKVHHVTIFRKQLQNLMVVSDKCHLKVHVIASNITWLPMQKTTRNNRTTGCVPKYPTRVPQLDAI